MPFTFVEIEERKTTTLAFLFLLLILLYVASTALLCAGTWYVLNYSPLDVYGRTPSGMRQGGILQVLLMGVGLACVIALLHWRVATYRIVDRVLEVMRASPLDAEDSYHARLAHIVEEAGVATGGRYRLEAHVLSTTAMNACAVADTSGRAAIIVTEGLLARLSREQLEAVIGHEAGHIARGDSISMSVLCSLFSFHEAALKRLTGMIDAGDDVLAMRGRGAVVELLCLVVLWLTVSAKRFCELGISRQQEYRADAVAVRLTRDPIALAEALHQIRRRWRGIGLAAEAFGSIFIIDPGADGLAEEEGVIPELFSTHPPVAKRIQAILGMAHVSPEAFERQLDDVLKERPKQLVQLEIEGAPPSSRWYVRGAEQWVGPLSLPEIEALPAFAPESWVRREGETAIRPAYQIPELLQMVRRRYEAQPGPAPGMVRECPNCHVSLARMQYEGTPLDRCPACGGCYVTPEQLQRIFAREEYAFPDSIKRLARCLPDVQGTERIVKRFDAMKREWLKDRQCPECGGAIARKFYTAAYFVEVEQCMSCGLAWLDRGELELLQYLYEEGSRQG